MLAALLMVPSVAYFQKLHFEGRRQEGLAARVAEVLADEGVRNAGVRMEWLDATIEGEVESEERRLEVAEAVEWIRGVRVPPFGNRLRAQGSLTIERRDGQWSARGVLPTEFEVRWPRGAVIPEDASDLRRSSYVVAPAGAWAWGEFLDRYFTEAGNRAVTLKAGRLLMEGNATGGLRSDWLAEASGVVGRESVEERFALFPSVYHMPAYRPQSITDSARLERLREQLRFLAVVFEQGSVEIPASESGKVSGLAAALLSSGDDGCFVVGGHPPRGRDFASSEELALRRAEAVLQLLREYGVPEERLEVMILGRGSRGDRENQVEVVVK
jgi:outer membrane protein OmpA-like peptidoglycan-associated protein